MRDALRAMSKALAFTLGALLFLYTLHLLAIGFIATWRLLGMAEESAPIGALIVMIWGILSAVIYFSTED